MKLVQDALRATAIEAFPDVWQPIDKKRNPPPEYITYTVSSREDEHLDDMAVSLRTYVYMNLWTEGDPTQTAAKVRAAMRAAGFAMAEEMTGTSSSARYDSNVKRRCVSWTWAISREVD